MSFEETVKRCPKCGAGRDEGGIKFVEGFHLFGRKQFKCEVCGWKYSKPEEVNRLTEATQRESKRTHITDNKRGFSLAKALVPPRRKGKRKGRGIHW